MVKTKKIWLDGKIIDWNKANIHIINHSLHYGSAVFEGIRAYDTPEGPGENIFFIKNKTLYTPKTGTILPGITRDTIFKIAKDLGYKIVEKTIKPKDIKTFEEAFFCGTAVEVCPIGKIDKHSFKSIIKSKEIQKEYMDVVCGENGKYKKYLALIN